MNLGLATQLHKPYHERNLHKAVSFIAHVKYIMLLQKKFLDNDSYSSPIYSSINRLDQLKKTLPTTSGHSSYSFPTPVYVLGKREHTRRRTHTRRRKHKYYQHFHFNRLRGYPNLRRDTNISGNMGTPGYPILYFHDNGRQDSLLTKR